MNFKDVFTIGCAVVGAVLGITNTWHGLNQRKVQLRVVPKIAHPVTGSGELMGTMGCIEVLNLSLFPVTVGDVGFTIKGDPRRHKRVAIVKPIIHDGKEWPRRLDSRASVSIYFPLESLNPGVKKAYALTDCGQVAYGDSPALNAIRRGIHG